MSLTKALENGSFWLKINPFCPENEQKARFSDGEKY
jgi:hypothetical protein